MRSRLRDVGYLIRFGPARVRPRSTGSRVARCSAYRNHIQVQIMKRLPFAVLVTCASASAFAEGGSQTAQTIETQRDVNQQQRIEQGLESGQLDMKEAGRLEREEAH